MGGLTDMDDIDRFFRDTLRRHSSIESLLTGGLWHRRAPESALPPLATYDLATDQPMAVLVIYAKDRQLVEDIIKRINIDFPDPIFGYEAIRFNPDIGIFCQLVWFRYAE
jgi:hypothetical protein